jgi:hypothetical protein
VRVSLRALLPFSTQQLPKSVAFFAFPSLLLQLFYAPSVYLFCSPQISLSSLLFAAETFLLLINIARSSATLLDIERFASFSAYSTLLIQAACCALLSGHGERYDVRLLSSKL